MEEKKVKKTNDQNLPIYQAAEFFQDTEIDTDVI